MDKRSSYQNGNKEIMEVVSILAFILLLHCSFIIVPTAYLIIDVKRVKVIKKN